jgi:hypothetical protein
MLIAAQASMGVGGAMMMHSTQNDSQKWATQAIQLENRME